QVGNLSPQGLKRLRSVPVSTSCRLPMQARGKGARHAHVSKIQDRPAMTTDWNPVGKNLVTVNGRVMCILCIPDRAPRRQNPKLPEPPRLGVPCEWGKGTNEASRGFEGRPNPSSNPRLVNRSRTRGSYFFGGSSEVVRVEFCVWVRVTSVSMPAISIFR